MLHNLFASVPTKLPEEVFETLVHSSTVRIERILSQGHCSPADFWYDQPEHEFVVLLQGAARVQFETQTVELKPGDYLNIPAHQRHRVEWTTPHEPTIWLAIHYG